MKVSSMELTTYRFRAMTWVRGQSQARYAGKTYMVMTDVDDVFVDTNVLVFATSRRSPVYNVAHNRLRELLHLGSSRWLSRQIIREYLVVVTRRMVEERRQGRRQLLDEVSQFH